MYPAAHKKLQQIIEQAQSDPEYPALDASLREQEVRYQALAQSLPQEQRDILTEYLSIRADLALRLLELACFSRTDIL